MPSLLPDQLLLSSAASFLNATDACARALQQTQPHGCMPICTHQQACVVLQRHEAHLLPEVQRPLPFSDFKLCHQPLQCRQHERGLSCSHLAHQDLIMSITWHDLLVYVWGRTANCMGAEGWTHAYTRTWQADAASACTRPPGPHTPVAPADSAQAHRLPWHLQLQQQSLNCFAQKHYCHYTH